MGSCACVQSNEHSVEQRISISIRINYIWNGWMPVQVRIFFFRFFSHLTQHIVVKLWNGQNENSANLNDAFLKLKPMENGIIIKIDVITVFECDIFGVIQSHAFTFALWTQPFGILPSTVSAFNGKMWAHYCKVQSLFLPVLNASWKCWYRYLSHAHRIHYVA